MAWYHILGILSIVVVSLLILGLGVKYGAASILTSIFEELIEALFD